MSSSILTTALVSILGPCLMLAGSQVRAFEAMDGPGRDTALPERHLVAAGPGRRSRSIEEIRLQMEQLRPRFLAAYDEALKADPNVAGKVLLEFTVASSGQVTGVQVVRSDLAGPQAAGVGEALVVILKAARFPAEDVETMVVRFPFDLAPR